MRMRSVFFHTKIAQKMMKFNAKREEKGLFSREIVYNRRSVCILNVEQLSLASVKVKHSHSICLQLETIVLEQRNTQQ